MPSRFSARAPRVLLLVALMATVLTACDSSGDDASDKGTFQAQVSGDAQASLRGPAAFAIGTEGGKTISAIGLVNTEDDEDALFLVLDGRATVKTYSVGDDKAAAFLVLHGTGSEGDLYIAESGSVTVTTADATRLAGSFDLTAVSVADDTDSVRIRGTFTAKPGTVDMPEDPETRRPSRF